MALPASYLAILDCLNQAKALFALAEDPDTDYLVRRISEEGGDPGLIGIKPWRGTVKA